MEKAFPWIFAVFTLAFGFLAGSYIFSQPTADLERLEVAVRNLPTRIEKACGQPQGKEEILKELAFLGVKQDIAINDTRALQDHLEGVKDALRVMAERYWQTQPKR